MTLSPRAWWGMGTAVAIGLTVWFGVILKRDQGPNLSKEMAFDQKMGAQVPVDALVRNEEGEEVRFGSFFKSDRPVALMLIFYQCKGTCLLEFEGAMKIFRALRVDDIGKSYDVVTLSIHPKETPELAKAKKSQYLALYNRRGSENGWHFLTGDEDQVRKIAASVGFQYYYNPEKDQVVHPTGLVVLTPEGRTSKYFMGTEYSSVLFRDSLVAASNNAIGIEDKREFLMGCFQFDPSTGKTRFHVWRALQLVGFATLIALLSSIVVMNRKYVRTRQDGLMMRLEEISQGKEDSTGREA